MNLNNNMDGRRFFKLIGLGFVFFGILANPFFLEWLFSPDGKLDFLWKYIVIFIFDLFCVFLGLFIYFKPHMFKTKFDKKGLMLLFFVFFICLIFLELQSSLILMKYESVGVVANFGSLNTAYIDRDPVKEGYVLKENMSLNISRTFINGSLIYNVHHSTDEFGRRVVGQEYVENNSHLMLFIGSVAYGDGLEDNETLQYLLGKEMKGYNVYNYGVGGYGPQHMLALIENGSLSSQVSSTEGIVVYVFIRHHIERAVGRPPWTLNFPDYGLNEAGKLERKGSFKESRPLYSGYRRFMYFLLDKSRFLRVVYLNLPKKEITPEEVNLTFEIIKKSRDVYESQFNGTFYVLIHPLYNVDENEDIIRLLQNEGIPVLNYEMKDIDVSLSNSSLLERAEKYAIYGDWHPNYETNKILSKLIVRDLDK